MRIHNVTITGFGPFRDTEHVDFDAFDDDGIFLITGRTGAGKTSILDAVSFALFGAVPRYGGGVDECVRSNFLQQDQPCRVSTEFTIGEIRYRITRTTGYVRRKTRGEGTTTVKSAAQLERHAAGGWDVLETQVRDTQKRVDEIVRLNAEQFRQVVLLAQGQFQEFLVANSDNRSKLLRRLFGTERFVSYRETLDRRVKDLAGRQRNHRDAAQQRSGDLARLAGTDAPTIEPSAELLAWVDTVVAAQDEVVLAASSRKTALTEQLNAARGRYETVKSVAERQARRDRERANKARLEAEASAIDGDRRRLEAARRAELAAQAVDGWRDAAATLTKESENHKEAEAAYLTVWQSLPDDPGEVPRTVEDLSHQIGFLRGHLEKELGLGALEQQVESTRTELAAHDQRIVEGEAERTTLRARAAEVTERAETLGERAGQLPMAELRHGEATEKCGAAHRAEKLSREHDRARLEALAAGHSLSAASTTRDELRLRQLSGYAGVLAGALVPDEPCAVCGSPEHPNPASLGDDHASEADVTDAERAVQAAIDASRTADAEAKGLQERLAAERDRCGGLSVAEAEAQRELVEAEVVTLRAVRTEAEAAEQEQGELQARIERLGADLEGSIAMRGDLVAAVKTAGDRLTETSRVLAEARATFPSVAARLADIESRCSVGQRLVTTQQAVTAAGETESRQRALMADVLDRNGFAGAADVLDARLEKSEGELLTQRVGGYDAEVAAVTMVLAATDLQDLPDEPVDLTGPAEEKHRIEEELRAAEDALGTARPVLDLMHGAADQLAVTTREYLAVRTRLEVVARLAASIRGDAPNTMNMELEAFVLAAELEDIVQAANVRLKTMTSGRYELQHSDALARYRASSGLSLKVLDAHTGEARSPDSLSGGEKFQASLALALGLAEVVTGRAGGMRLDTLFIDEGFGSLDDTTLDTTMATLDSLREGGRTVGLISHVATLRESIPAQLKVTVVPGGWSVIDQPGQPRPAGCDG